MSVDARSDVGVGLRSAVEAFLDCDQDAAALSRAVELLTELREVLSGPPRPRYYERGVEEMNTSRDAFRAYLDETPFGGGSHPVSPPGSLDLDLDPDQPAVIGRVTAGRAYEGPARCVHGGFVAGLFDHFLGMAQNAYNRVHGTQVFAATRELTVRFRAPTPLDTELVFRAWVEDVDQRTLRGHATCHADGVLTATAEGEFVKVGARILFTEEGGFRARPPAS